MKQVARLLASNKELSDTLQQRDHRIIVYQNEGNALERRNRDLESKIRQLESKLKTSCLLEIARDRFLLSTALHSCGLLLSLVVVFVFCCSD